MKPSIEKLTKFFQLETDREFDNKAVMGGFSSMLTSWEAEARAEDLDEDLIKAVTARLRDYDNLSPNSRRDVLKGLRSRIKRIEQGEQPKEQPKQEKPKADQPKREKSKPSAESKPRTERKPGQEPRQEEQAEKQEQKPKRRRKQRQPRPKPEGPAAALDAKVTVLDGVGPKNAEKLANLGIENLNDMLYHFPRRYDDYTQLKTINRLDYGEEVTVIGTVQSAAVRNTHGGKVKLVEVVISDGTGSLRLTWFNQPWLTNSIKKDEGIVVSGKIEQYLGRLVMNSPEWEPLEDENLHTNRIVPIYPLTAKIGQRWLRGQMNKVVNYWAVRVEEPLPENVRSSAKVMELSEALLQAHFPESWEDLEDARYRLAFDEIFYLQLGVVQQKRRWNARPGHKYDVSQEWLDSQTSALPYTLTKAQQKALKDIQGDLQSGRPMNRLLQGDVGSGKTVVAGLAVGMVIQHGPQAAILAPTSILAEQHFNSFTKQLAGEGGLLAPDQIRLLIGATGKAERRDIQEGLSSGHVKLIIGTHALLEDPVEFQNLQIAIIDEQHRFGVEQRAALRAKGDNPHLLVMTATPIPRSLALTVFGDLDLIVMDEMPPGRLPVDTFVLYPNERERAYTLIRKQIELGHQAFIIYPLVEESDKSDAKAAVEEHERLQNEIFPKLKVGLLHGRLKPAEKDATMTQFRDKELDILVSTSVVEVGVDVPNATVMLIEGANRFGLAQLHQFRGRVGRGGDKAYCLLIPQDNTSAENERLTAMTETTDGFKLAEVDLNQRGPGQFLGSRQSGFNELQMAALGDVRLIEKARNEAGKLLEADPDLEKPEHKLLNQTLQLLWHNGKGEIS